MRLPVYCACIAEFFLLFPSQSSHVSQHVPPAWLILVTLTDAASCVAVVPWYCYDMLQTERAWASKIIRGQVEPDHLPGLQDYLAAVQQRREGAGRAAAAHAGLHTWA